MSRIRPMFWIPIRIANEQDTICDMAYSPFYATS